MTALHDVAVLIPFDPGNRTYMVVRSTNWHPKPAFRHQIKGIGGLVERGESPRQAVLREREEEQPGWFLRFPGTSSGWGEVRVPAKDGLHSAGAVSAEGIVWNLFLAPTDLGLHSFRTARAVALESTPEVWTLGTIPHPAECLPGFRAVILRAHKIIGKAYPSLSLSGLDPAKG